MPRRTPLEIEISARIRLADEYDEAQKRGEVQTPGGDRKTIVASHNNDPTIAELGLRRDEIYNSRQLRDAAAAFPGLVRRVVDASCVADRQRKIGFQI